MPARLATVIGAPAFIQQESDHRHRLLRARRQRPSRRAAEQRDEIAPFVRWCASRSACFSAVISSRRGVKAMSDENPCSGRRTCSPAIAMPIVRSPTRRHGVACAGGSGMASWRPRRGAE